MSTDGYRSAASKPPLRRRLSVADADISLDVIHEYWQEVEHLTSDLQPTQRFSTPELEKYFHQNLPSDIQSITKTKLKYLRDQGILRPDVVGEGEQRTSWRYTLDDVRRTLLAELLKSRAGLSVQEIKGWLRSFDEVRRTTSPVAQLPGYAPQRFAPPTPVNSAYTLLRNRVLGSLLTTLGQGEIETTPRESLIAIRPVEPSEEAPRPQELSSWSEARQLLEAESWYLAVGESYNKQNVYSSLEQFRKTRPDIAGIFEEDDFDWYLITLQDITCRLYEVVLGLPVREVQSGTARPIVRTIEKQIGTASPLMLSNYPGLTTVLKAAFINQPDIQSGTGLSALAEIISTVSDAWDFCAILLPEQTDRNGEQQLRINGYSSNFPSSLLEESVKAGQFLSGWCYRNRQDVVVEPVVEGDPRIAAYEVERPTAAAAVPAIAEAGQRVLGVVYVARQSPLPKDSTVFNQELMASLKMFGYVCGDIIAREGIESETVRNLTRLCMHTLRPHRTFNDLQSLIEYVTKVVQEGINLADAPHSWIYLLTLNIYAPPRIDPRLDTVMHWLYQLAANVSADFLANLLHNGTAQEPLPIGVCRVGSGKFVLTVLGAVDLPEETYKERLITLTKRLEEIQLRRLPTKYYPWGVTFRFETLRWQLMVKRADLLVEDLVEITEGALAAAPSISQGHAALGERNYIDAIGYFREAIRQAPENWYAHKHLAEALMLNGQVDEAIQQCKEALQRNPDYASALCILADGLASQGRYDEALVEYERTLKLNYTRPDFLIRYGITLARMTQLQYQKGHEMLQGKEPELARRPFRKEPYLEALDKFKEAQQICEALDETPQERRERLGKYHFHCGVTYLQAGHVDEAVKELLAGQKQKPDDRELAQILAYVQSLSEG